MYIYIFFILVGSIVCLSTIVMTIWFKTNRSLNVYIIFTSFLLCLYLILYGLNNIKSINEISDFWSINYRQIILVLTPSVYLFFDKIVLDIKYIEKKDIFYFVIPILFYNYLSTELYLENNRSKLILYVLLILYTFFYIYKSYWILKPHIWDNPSNDKGLNLIVKNWISFIFKMMVVVMIHFYISEIFNLWLINKGIVNLVFEVGFLFIFLIGYFKVISTPELLYGSAFLKKVSDNKKVAQLCLDKVWDLELNSKSINNRELLVFNKIEPNISIYIAKIEQITIVGDSFKRSGYSINDLSNDIGVPKYYLEFIFKYYCKLTFNEYKKLVRIHAAVELIKNGYLNCNKLDSLAKHVGFASYNPFLVNFKEITGVSPFEFNKNRTIHNNSFLQ